jgi:hypothetical protein
MIDIVTVVFRDELPVLKLQAESISLYCNHMCLHTICVVINDDTMTSDDIDVEWWGRYSDRVKIIHRNQWKISYVENGWLTQQLLKLLVAEQSKSTWSMVLDSKTIIVQSVELDRLFDDNGRLTWGYNTIFPVFDSTRKKVSELFEIDQQYVLGPAGIPFFFNNQTVRDMINEVKKRTNKNFAEWFQDTGMITEFMLYSGYVQYRDGTLEKSHTNNFPDSYGLCNICHSEVDKVDSKFLQMLNNKNLTVSIHRNAWSKLTPAQRKTYQDFLLSKGITQAQNLL